MVSELPDEELDKLSTVDYDIDDVNPNSGNDFEHSLNALQREVKQKEDSEAGGATTNSKSSGLALKDKTNPKTGKGDIPNRLKRQLKKDEENNQSDDDLHILEGEIITNFIDWVEKEKIANNTILTKDNNKIAIDKSRGDSNISDCLLIKEPENNKLIYIEAKVYDKYKIYTAIGQLIYY